MTPSLSLCPLSFCLSQAGLRPANLFTAFPLNSITVEVNAKAWEWNREEAKRKLNNSLCYLYSPFWSRSCLLCQFKAIHKMDGRTSGWTGDRLVVVWMDGWIDEASGGQRESRRSVYLSGAVSVNPPGIYCFPPTFPVSHSSVMKCTYIYVGVMLCSQSGCVIYRFKAPRHLLVYCCLILSFANQGSLDPCPEAHCIVGFVLIPSWRWALTGRQTLAA